MGGTWYSMQTFCHDSKFNLQRTMHLLTHKKRPLKGSYQPGSGVTVIVCYLSPQWKCGWSFLMDRSLTETDTQSFIPKLDSHHLKMTDSLIITVPWKEYLIMEHCWSHYFYLNLSSQNYDILEGSAYECGVMTIRLKRFEGRSGCAKA